MLYNSVSNVHIHVRGIIQHLPTLLSICFIYSFKKFKNIGIEYHNIVSINMILHVHTHVRCVVIYDVYPLTFEHDL